MKRSSLEYNTLSEVLTGGVYCDGLLKGLFQAKDILLLPEQSLPLLCLPRQWLQRG